MTYTSNDFTSGAWLFKRAGQAGNTVTAHFKNGASVEYSNTAEMLYLLKTDRDVVEIVDNRTGELLYISEM